MRACPGSSQSGKFFIFPLSGRRGISTGCASSRTPEMLFPLPDRNRLAASLDCFSDSAAPDWLFRVLSLPTVVGGNERGVPNALADACPRPGTDRVGPAPIQKAA